MELEQLEVEFQAFLQDLTSVEKKVIHALTDIARDILRTRPQGAPVVAAVITTRVVQAPVSFKLPTLYLLDSIVKLVGEPYISYFAPRLPEAGNDGLHKSLQKLYATWQGVFPQPVLTDVAARVAQLPPAPAAVPAMPPYYQPPGQQAVMVPEVPQPTQPMYRYGLPQQPIAVPLGMQPAAAVPAGYGFLAQEVPQQPVYVQQPPVLDLSAQPVYSTAPQLHDLPAATPLPSYVQQQALQPSAAQPAFQPAQPPVDVASLMASLVNSGILAAPPATQGGAAQPPATAAGSLGDSTPPAATTPLRPEEPVSLEFTPERIKDKNPAAVHRLMQHTESTKGQFLDRKFLRRQRRTGTLRTSRLWYVDLDTWMASTVGTKGFHAAQEQQQQEAAAAAAAPELCTVPVDDSQIHCALSGERFQQFWDEQHQEWRYRDAKRLDAEEAARYGLQEGALVLVSALGAPAGNLLQPSAGVLSAMRAEQEIAADLAAATATAALGRGVGEAAGGPEGKEDVKMGLKHEREEEAAAAAAGEQAEQKRLRVH